jgi:ketosteroid isomerase-like protein
MMAQANVELYRRAWEAWNDGDLDAFIALTSPDWQIRTTETWPGIKPVYRGHDGVVEFWNTVREPWKDFFMDVERAIAAGDQVVGLLRLRGIGATSGVPITREYGHVATYVDGKNVAIQGYLTHREALDAAGVSG